MNIRKSKRVVVSLASQTQYVPQVGLPQSAPVTSRRAQKIKPTKFLPLWDVLGVALGFGSTIIGKKAAMLCTASVEEVIYEHYKNQIDQIKDDEKILKKKITKFRLDEIHHKDIAYQNGATKKGVYSLIDKIIKTGSRVAINISEKI